MGEDEERLPLKWYDSTNNEKKKMFASNGRPNLKKKLDSRELIFKKKGLQLNKMLGSPKILFLNTPLVVMHIFS